MLSFVKELLRNTGALLLKQQSRQREIAFKVRHSDLVTDADRLAEDTIIHAISSAYPRDGIVSEESGYRPGTSRTTWVIDPLDGTANFAAGMPDFGTIIGVVREGQPWIGGMYLPAYQALYLAERGRGATRNDQEITVTRETELKNVLIDHSFHFRDDPPRMEREKRILRAVWPAVRGIRSAGCLRYLAQLAEGQIGGFIAHEIGVWDIAGPTVVLEEAGAIVTDLHGHPLDLRVDEETWGRSLRAVGGRPELHAQLIALIQQAECAAGNFSC